MIEQDQQEQALAKLRDKIEETIGRKMKTPKDFDFLSEQVFEKLHETVSSTTLKRIWGYLSEASIPRISTLDILSQYVGYTDWASFMEHAPNLALHESQDAETVSAKPAPKVNTHSYLKLGGIFTVLLIVFAAVFYFWGRPSFSETEETESKPSSSKYILTIGQKFKSHQEYLKFFGILNPKVLYGQQVPNHPNIWTWGPTYHHRHWHNDGDSAKMLPTITEYWTGEGATKEATAVRNTQQYFHYLRLNELRIAFVKNLVDTNFVFTGVYRMSLELSDTTKLVWERVADEVDLNNLDYLETLRNDLSLASPGSPWISAQPK